MWGLDWRERPRSLRAPPGRSVGGENEAQGPSLYDGINPNRPWRPPPSFGGGGG